MQKPQMLKMKECMAWVEDLNKLSQDVPHAQQWHGTSR
jgi:hypothetical protein